MDVAAYLERIGYTGPTTADRETLRRVHRAHMLTVPFENLDIPLKREIVCDEGAFLRKIVDRRRGGFCYEMNGAFAALLRGLGFQVTLLSARVARDDGSDGPEMDHLALRVDLEEPWLADVGFGDSFLEPLRLNFRKSQKQGERRFRIVPYHGDLEMQMGPAELRWRTEYRFSLQSRRLHEFAAMCHYHQTSPQSPFTRKKLCTIATPEGRITLSDMRLIITRSGTKQEQTLESEEAWTAALKQYFGVVL